MDGRALSRLRPPRAQLFHALDLIDEYGDGAEVGCSRDCEVAARFANVADEMLVLGGVPEAAIIGGGRFDTILLHLPAYFFREERRDLPPWRRSIEDLDDAFSRKSYREAYLSLSRNVTWSVSTFSPASHADEAVTLAAYVCGEPPGSDNTPLIHGVQTVAGAVLNWVISWRSCDRLEGWGSKGVGVLDLDQYLSDYIRFASALAISDASDQVSVFSASNGKCHSPGFGILAKQFRRHTLAWLLQSVSRRTRLPYD